MLASAAMASTTSVTDDLIVAETKSASTLGRPTSTYFDPIISDLSSGNLYSTKNE